jgi:hypothetical protein
MDNFRTITLKIRLSITSLYRGALLSLLLSLLSEKHLVVSRNKTQDYASVTPDDGTCCRNIYILGKTTFFLLCHHHASQWHNLPIYIYQRNTRKCYKIKHRSFTRYVPSSGVTMA